MTMTFDTEHNTETSDERRSQKLRPRFLSINGSCDYLNCSRAYFYATIYPKVKKVKLGDRRTLIDFDSLDEVADAFPVVSTPAK